MHLTLGELSWASLSPSDREAWNLSPQVPDDAPEFIHDHLRTVSPPATVQQKMGIYSFFLDLMGWRRLQWLKTPEYLLPGLRPVPHGSADRDLNGCMTGSQLSDPESRRLVLRHFLPSMIGEIRAGRMERAALFGGLLAHFIQDGAAVGHVFPNSMFYEFAPEDPHYHRHYHSMLDECNPELATCEPALLGTSTAEAVFRLGVLGDQNEVRAKHIFFPMLEAGRNEDRETMNDLARPLLESAVFQVASLWHTSLALGLGTCDPSEAESLRTLDLCEAVPYECHPGGKYGRIVRGHSVVEGRLVPLRVDLGSGPETVRDGFGMTSFVAAKFLLEPGAFSRFDGAVGLSCDNVDDQEPSMDVEFFVGLDRDYNRVVSSELDYGAGMKKAHSVKLHPESPSGSFSVPLGGAKTLVLAVRPYPVIVGGKEKCWFPHVVVANPRLVK